MSTDFDPGLLRQQCDVYMVFSWASLSKGFAQQIPTPSYFGFARNSAYSFQINSIVVGPVLRKPAHCRQRTWYNK